MDLENWPNELFTCRVLLLQLPWESGPWAVANARATNFDLSFDESASRSLLDPLLADLESFVLEPGDSLYIPGSDAMQVR